MATLTVPAQVPSVAEDVEQLRKAFEGWGTNEDLIISILGHRNACQRKTIRHAYAETYGKDLLKDLDKELTSEFEKLVLLWTLDPAERDALLAYEATKRWTKSNLVLVEIACTRPPKELVLAREAYHARYKRSLEEDVAYHTTGEFRKLLLPLVSSYRYDGEEVNIRLAKSEAKVLHEKIKGKHYCDDEVIRIVATRSKVQVNATLNEYKNEYGNDIIKDLEHDDDNEFLPILKATFECLVYPENYFEKVLREAVKKWGTDEGALARVVATRAEVDLKIIKELYHKRNSVPLHRAVVKDTHGHYEKMLVALIGEDDA